MDFSECIPDDGWDGIRSDRNERVYLSTPSDCPVCGAEDVEADSTYADGGMFHAELYCSQCGHFWTCVRSVL